LTNASVAAVASGDVALVTPAAVARGETAELSCVVVANGDVALVKPVAVANGDTADESCVLVASGDTALVRPEAVAKPDVALVTPADVARPERLDTVASEPDVNVPSVRFRVAYDQTSDADNPPVDVSVRPLYAQTSATKVPYVVKDRVGDDQTAEAVSAASVPKEVSVRPLYAQIVEGSDESVDESVDVFVLLFVLIVETAPVISELVFASTAEATELLVTTGAFKINDSSSFKRSPVPVDPQVIKVGYFPSTPGVVYA
jgi:hypothetical protein